MKSTLFFWISIVAIISIKHVHAQVNFLNEDFSTCVSNLPSGWTKESVLGNQVWQCNTSGYTGSGVSINGYASGNNLNEDWLISPLIDLSTYSMPLLSFWCRTKYAGAFIELYASSNYIGAGPPSAATWTPINVNLPTSNSDVWFLSDQTNLSSLKSAPFYLAFKYTSTTSAAAYWRLDDISIKEGALSIAKKFVNAGSCAANYFSNPSSFQFTMTGLTGNLMLNAPSPFELSKDGTTFSNTISYSASASGIPQTVFVRIAPTVSDKVYRNHITFQYNGNAVAESVMALGTSFPDDKTLRVASWNMRWFGEPSWCNCDTALARQQASVVLKDLDADIYCIQEMVNVPKLNALTQALGPQYKSVVSPYCSGVTNPSSGLYQTCQKLAYIYDTTKINNIGTFGLLASTYPSSSTAYDCFSSGRFPFILKTVLNLANGSKDTLIFSNIHAKADNTISDYNRRKCGSESMTDSLLALFPQQKTIIIGDFNDYLEGTTVSSQTNSPYLYTMNNGFQGITLPSLYPGASTYVGSTNHIIDNIMLNNALLTHYADSSFYIFTEAEKYINDFSYTTSDHFPIVAHLKFNFPNGVESIQKENSLPFTVQNPVGEMLTFLVENESNEPLQVKILDISGHVLLEKKLSGGVMQHSFSVASIQCGIYLMSVQQAEKRSIKKLTILKN
ncbi:MAG: choice-of-anchor J domain-containing protein [Chitinophagaceae bacterium]